MPKVPGDALADRAANTGDYRNVIYETLIGDGGSPDWHVHNSSYGGSDWIVARYTPTPLPGQGWKLHVTAEPGTAVCVLTRSAEVLRRHKATFKVVANEQMLRRLNSALAGPSQIGKFITVYPRDDTEAVELAHALDVANWDWTGPAVPSDRPLRRGSPVHYRYGAFVGGLTVQSPVGEITSALIDERGDLVPDLRRQDYVEPEWVDDPFLAKGAAEPASPRSPLLANRYVLLGSLYRSHTTTVHLAVDLDAGRRCVVKQARRGNLVGAHGTDSTDRLRQEAAVLTNIPRSLGIPAALDLIEGDDDLSLVTDDVPGENLESRILSLHRRGLSVATDRLLCWLRELAEALEHIHAAGYVHCDIKPSNIIVRPDDSVTLIDFNSVQPLDARAQGDDIGRTGTPGYMSPQFADGEPPAITDDIYGLGCVLYYAATGAQPAQTAPPLRGVHARPCAVLGPWLDERVRPLVERCVNPVVSRRFPSARSVARAVRAASQASGTPPSPHAREDEGARAREVEGAEALAGDVAGRHYRRLAEGTALALIGEARPAPGGGVAWVSAHASSRGFASRDLSMGSAGALLAVADLAADIGSPALHEALHEGARWLSRAPRPGGDPLPGLYVGEAGIAAALLRAGQVAREPAWVDAAAERSRQIARLPHGSPDLFNGTAGRLRFHLLLYEVTGDPECLHAAMAAGEVLLDGVHGASDEGCSWIIPQGYGEMSDQAFLGYAHGAAGIADALLDLVEVTGNDRYLPVVTGAARWLSREALPAGAGQGLAWPTQPGGTPCSPFWCHGAAGIGQFFLRAASLDVVDNALDLARRSAIAAATLARGAGPSQCHGLAGNIEFLLDTYRATGDGDHLKHARALAQLMEGFVLEEERKVRWFTEVPGMTSPDYLVGYGGIAVVLLRLADPARPRHLTVRGLGGAPGALAHR